MDAEDEKADSTKRSSQAVDLQNVLDIAGGDVRLLRSLLAGFLDEIPLLVRALEEAIERRDAAALQDTAHKLKGVVRYLRMDAAFQEADKLEQWSDRPGHWPEAEAMLASLRRMLDEAIRVLRDFLTQAE